MRQRNHQPPNADAISIVKSINTGIWRLKQAFSQNLRLGLGLIGISSTIIVQKCDRVFAQLRPIADTAPDRNLGTLVSPFNAQIDQITGGTARGTNIFHSFSEFNIDTGRGAYFANPAGIINIISRVTGNNISQILGTLGVGIPGARGTANLFLINPNGIIFGQGARLNIGGSFVATTANALQFPDGNIFSASTPNNPAPTLTVNPSAFLYNQIANQQSRRIEVKNGANLGVGFAGTPANLLLVGGDVLIDGSTLQGASGSQIQIGGFTGTGSVGLIVDDTQIGLDTPFTGVTGANVTINNSIINLGTRDKNAGNIFITGGTISLTGRTALSTSTFGSGNAGLVFLQADNVSVDNSSLFSTAESGSSGNSGGILIDAGTVSLNNSRLDTTNKGSGIAGDMIVKGRDRVSIVDSNILSTSQNATTNSGFGFLSIGATEGSVFLNNTKVSTTNTSSGLAGDISISASDTVSLANNTEITSQGYLGRIILGASKKYATFSPRNVIIDHSRLSTTNFNSKLAGDISIGASEQVSINQSGIFSNGWLGRVFIGKGNVNTSAISPERIIVDRSTIQTTSPVSGRAGDILLNASDTIGIKNSQIRSDTVGAANAGRIGLQTNNNLSVANSIITTQVQANATGDAGRVDILSGSLSLDNLALISSSTFGTGDAGLVFVQSGDVTFSNTSGLLSIVGTDATGNAGGIGMQVISLDMKGGSLVTTSVLGKGNAGGIIVLADNDVSVGGGSSISSTVEESATGTAGGIIITGRTLYIRDNSQVSVNNAGVGEAGGIGISTRDLRLENRGRLTAVTRSGLGGDMYLKVRDLLVLTRNSDISTTAGLAPGGGNGGNININTQYIFGVPTDDNNITAQAFSGNGGKIFINASKLYKIDERSNDFLNTNDITASSRGGGVNGQVKNNVLNTDPTQGLTNLPVDAVDTSRLIAQRCALRSRTSPNQENKFIVTQRGGLPSNPNETLQNDSVVTPWVTLDSPGEKPTSSANMPPPTPQSSKSAQYVEAQGWVINKLGEVVLTAQAPTATPQSPTQTTGFSCNGS